MKGRRLFPFNVFLIVYAVLLCQVVHASETVVFRAASWLPPQHPATRSFYTEWVKDVETISKGELVPKLFIGSAVVAPREGLSAVRDGIVHIGFHSGNQTPAENPHLSALEEIALNFDDPLATLLAVTDFNIFDAELKRHWLHNNIVYGAAFNTPNYNLLCRMPVRTLADLRGKKVRAPFPMQSEWLKQVGAIPLTIVSNEQYTALERGVLDCTLTVVSDYLDRRLLEVTPYVNTINTGSFWSGFAWGINLDFWSGLTTQHRRVLLDTMASGLARYLAQATQSSQKSLVLANERGQLIVPSNKMRQSLHDFSKEQEKIALYLAGKRYRLKNPETLFNRFKAKVADWEERVAGLDRNNEAELTAFIKREIFDRIDINHFRRN